MPGFLLVAGAAALSLNAAHASAPSRSPASAAVADDATSPTAPKPHLVIAPERFREALGPYLAWRASTRQNDGVVFASLESLLDGAAPDDRDAPERLKTHLYERWKRGALGTCLLVGDGDTLPVRFMTLDRGDAAAANWAFYPSDLYYADLARADGSFEPWNGRRDGCHERYFGEVHGETNKDGPINADGMDLDPEIAVGRWPVSSAEEAAALAAKTIAWEQATARRIRAAGLAANADADGIDGAIFAVGGWVDCRDRARGIGKSLHAALPRGARAFIHDDAPSTAPNIESMQRVLADGALIVLHSGHGQPWGWEQCLSAEVIDGAKIPADAPAPILFSAGCSTAEWSALPPYTAYRDESGAEHKGTTGGERFESPPPAPGPIQAGPFNRTSLSEQLVRRPHGGAIAVIGCSTGSQPCAVTLLEGFADACAALSRESTAPTLGEAWRRSLRDYKRRERLDQLVATADWYPPSIFFQGMKFVLLGDPSLRLPLRHAAPDSSPAPTPIASPTSAPSH